MNVYEITQNTEKWLEWRNTGLGASDAATILGCNPYMTEFQLWEIMTGRKKPPDLSKNFNVQRGNRLEPLARSTAEKYIKQKLHVICAAEVNNPFVLTSFDGITADRKIVCELKCPHETTFYKILSEKEKSTFYFIYWIQVQQQLYVSKAEVGYLIFFIKGKNGDKNKILPFKILPDVKFQEEELLPKLKRFWNLVQHDIAPPLDTERDNCAVDEKAWLELSNQYKELNTTLSNLNDSVILTKEKLEPVKNQITSLLRDNSLAEHNGLRVKKFSKTGKVDYSSLIDELLQKLKLQNIDLNKNDLINKYRDAPTIQYKFTQPSKVDELSIVNEKHKSSFIL